MVLRHLRARNPRRKRIRLHIPTHRRERHGAQGTGGRGRATAANANEVWQPGEAHGKIMGEGLLQREKIRKVPVNSLGMEATNILTQQRDRQHKRSNMKVASCCQPDKMRPTHRESRIDSSSKHASSTHDRPCSLRSSIPPVPTLRASSNFRWQSSP